MKRLVLITMLVLAACQEASGHDRDDESEDAPRKKKNKKKQKQAPAVAGASPELKVVDDGLEPVKGERFPFSMRVPRGSKRELDVASQEFFGRKAPDGRTIACTIDNSSLRAMPKTEPEAVMNVHVEGYAMKPMFSERSADGGWNIVTERVKGVPKNYPELFTGALRVDAKGTVWRCMCSGSMADVELMKKATASFAATSG